MSYPLKSHTFDQIIGLKIRIGAQQQDPHCIAGETLFSILDALKNSIGELPEKKPGASEPAAASEKKAKTPKKKAAAGA